MKASELIERLQSLTAVHGDCDVQFRVGDIAMDEFLDLDVEVVDFAGEPSRFLIDG